MDAARPLRDEFADPSGEPGGLLRDLPDDLIAEAVVSYADTAPAEVAEHLAPFVGAHSVVGAHDTAADPPDWQDLLATVPAGIPDEAEMQDLSFGTGAEPWPAAEHDDGAGEEEPEEAGVTADDDVFGFDLPADPLALDEIPADTTDDGPLEDWPGDPDPLA
ncbi:hypothetical protein [Actinoplanes sp. NPDC023714]|uniref:hypothetical protein n=1 Tax=Actinoplanes sp. NPDC023714 TaxID=3154322 RepID=UPI0033C46FA2